MKLLLLGMLLMCGVTGCEEAARERAAFEDKAIRSVQEAESYVPGRSCKGFLQDALFIAQSYGKYIKVQGWQAYKEPGHTVVRFVAEENEKPLEWRWYIEGDEVIPVNALSQSVMRRQPAKYR